MAIKLFWANHMASHNVDSLVVTGKFYDDGSQAEVHDGAVVTIGNLEDHAFYTGMKDLNTRKVEAPTADTDRVAVVDIVNRTSGDIAGVTYREGNKTAGMTAPAGTPVRVRILNDYDLFTIGSGNIADLTNIATYKYLIPTADSTLWTLSNTAVDGKTNLYIEDSMPLTEGVVDTDTKYLCTVLPRTVAAQ